ncbi:hypothetical protein R3I93_016558 [Phoxinus phoxinus]|uniref:Uncharacterized protein n=1 Tax=Phoxinus phoxinus TaxID=58324 RepID=A0AAN9GZD6_9TELE
MKLNMSSSTDKVTRHDITDWQLASILRGRRRLWGDWPGWRGLIGARGRGTCRSCPVRGTRVPLQPPHAVTGTEICEEQ